MRVCGEVYRVSLDGKGRNLFDAVVVGEKFEVAFRNAV